MENGKCLLHISWIKIYIEIEEFYLYSRLTVDISVEVNVRIIVANKWKTAIVYFMIHELKFRLK